MTTGLLLTQLLNGLQLGVLLFLLSAGLTLVFGIMNFVNLSHGSLYMMGAYFAAAGYNAFGGSFLAAALLAIPGTMLLGVLVERIALSTLYARDHLDQVLATFGLILFFNEVVRFVWGPASVYMNVPKMLSGTVDLFGLAYPSYRFAIIVVGLLVGLALYLVIHRTRVGMLIRAGASNPDMVSALGVNIKGLNLTVFALGAGLAGLAGAVMAPLVSLDPQMGLGFLVPAFLSILVGGLGSVAAPLAGASAVGVTDNLVSTFFSPVWAQGVVFTVAILLIRAFPQGLMARARRRV